MITPRTGTAAAIAAPSGWDARAAIGAARRRKQTRTARATTTAAEEPIPRTSACRKSALWQTRVMSASTSVRHRPRQLSADRALIPVRAASVVDRFSQNRAERML